MFLKTLKLNALAFACMLSITLCSVITADQTVCCEDNSIVVLGSGKVSVQPDIAIVSIGALVDGKTSQQASQGVNDKINQIINILIANKVSKNDIETQYLSIYPKYDYSNGSSTIVGQTAQQTLSVTIRNIDQNGGNLGTIIDKLVVVDGIQFNGLNFDKADRTSAEQKARKKALQDAKTKAQDYACFAFRNLGKILAIIDISQSYPIPIYSDAKSFSVSTSINVGLLDISYSITVKFELD